MTRISIQCRRFQRPKRCFRSMRPMRNMSPQPTQFRLSQTVAGEVSRRHVWCMAVAAIINCSGLFSTSNPEAVPRFNTCTIRLGKLLAHKKAKPLISMATAQNRHSILRVAHQSTLLAMQMLSLFEDLRKHVHSKLEMRPPPLSVETFVAIALSTKNRIAPRLGTIQSLNIPMMEV